MKVYVVTSGEYSDYRIEKVFLDKDKAELYRDLHRHEDYYFQMEVEEYDSYDDNITGSREDMILFFAFKVVKGELYLGRPYTYAFLNGSEGFNGFFEYLDDYDFKVVGLNTFYKEDPEGDRFGIVLKANDQVLDHLQYDQEKAFRIACDKWAQYRYQLVEEGKYITTFEKTGVVKGSEPTPPGSFTSTVAL